MLDFFIMLILGMLTLFAILEIYTRTVGRWFANRTIYKACIEMEKMDNYLLDPDIDVTAVAKLNAIDGNLPITQISPRDIKDSK
jgi:hypothetical protein